MPSHDRRAAARRRAWGRGPMILRFEPMEGRQLLASGASTALPALMSTAFTTVHNADWGDTIDASGTIINYGQAPVGPGAIAGIYASPTEVIGPGAVLVGVVQIPAGLMPGAVQNYDQLVALPSTPIPGLGTGQPLWLGVRIDPQGVVQETTRLNNEGRGPGIDQSQVTITALRPSNLVGTSFTVSPAATTWGSTVTVTGQINNNAQGDAPPTRAKIVLTPGGQLPGGAADLTIGSVVLPAIPAFQTTNFVSQVTLPAAAPTLLAGQGSYLISMVQDADHTASQLIRPLQIQGVGLDTAVLTVGAGTNTGVAQGPLPDLAASGIAAPTTPIYWGQSFQVSTSVQNLGTGNAPGFRVRFLLTGVSGSTDQAIFLGDAQVDAGLKAGFSQDLVQTLKLPSRLPYGFTVGPIAYGRVVILIDPENQVEETNKGNNSATSNPVTLGLLGSDGTANVPVAPPVRSNAPVPVATPAPVAPVVPKKPTIRSIRARPKKPDTGLIAQFTNYEKEISNFINRVTARSKKKK